jgi:zinc transport system substrate-binding protein
MRRTAWSGAPERAPRRSRRAWVVLAVVTLLAMSGCTSSPDTVRTPAEATRPTVAVSIPPLAWFVERLAGEEVEVVALLPAGASPEQYEPSIHERKGLERASLLVLVGHPAFTFETSRLAPLVAERSGLAVVRAWNRGPGDEGDGSRRASARPDHDHDHDPHVWLSPAVALDLVDALAGALVATVPAAADRIEARRTALAQEVRDLDERIAARLAPFAGRRFYVFHPGWGAFAERYGLVQEAAEEHGSEPGPEHLVRLIERARADGVRTVFVQPQFAERGIRALADEVGADVRVLDPLARDWGSNLERAGEALAGSFR